LNSKVTIYIPSHNYGEYLEEAIESVLSQTYKNWELFLIDEGSTDNTLSIMETYKNNSTYNVKIIKNKKAIGLRACANKVIKKAKGEYIIRLDADDFFDDNALLVLSDYLDKNQDIALVYPNYFFINSNGKILAVEKHKKISNQTKLLDMPAHGACALVRTKIIKEIGGYNTAFDAQDGHELWLKIIEKNKVANVTTPLFYYRQHVKSLSRDNKRILNARMKIKRSMVNRNNKKYKILGVIPAKNTYKNIPNIVMKKIAGFPLIDYSISEAVKTNELNKIIVITDDKKVDAYCKNNKKITSLIRPKNLSKNSTLLSEVVENAVNHMENEHEFYPDIIVVMSIHSPLRKSKYIQKAIDTLVLYGPNSVISVYEDYGLHLKHGANGLEPFNWSSLKKVRLEREALYTDNGAIRAFWRKTLKKDDMFGDVIGHIVMPQEDSYQIKDEFTTDIINNIILKEK